MSPHLSALRSADRGDRASRAATAGGFSKTSQFEELRAAGERLPRLPEKFHAQIFCRGSFLLRNFSVPSMGDRGRGGPALCCTAPPRLHQRSSYGLAIYRI